MQTWQYLHDKNYNNKPMYINCSVSMWKARLKIFNRGVRPLRSYCVYKFKGTRCHLYKSGTKFFVHNIYNFTTATLKVLKPTV